MATADRTGTPWHLWAVAVVGLLWNAVGAYDYTMTQAKDMSYLSAMTPEQLAWIAHFPAWATSGWALGVWSAIAGSLLLLTRSRWAVAAFGVSLGGVAVTTVYQYGGTAPASYDTAGAKIFSAVIWAATAAQLGYAIAMQRRGILA